MRLGLFLAAGVALMACAARAETPDAAETALLHQAEGCLHDNAATVASVAKSEQDAIQFLVSGLCAEDIAFYSAYRRNAQTLIDWRANPPKPAAAPPPGHELSAYGQSEADAAAKTLAALPQITVDPKTGEFHYPTGFTPTPEMTLRFNSNFVDSMIGQQAHFMTIAAQAVLAAQKAGH
jgi:hypothetical protein